MLVGGAEDPSDPREMISIVYVHVGVAEVQLQSGATVWVSRTACDLLKCIWTERIDAAKAE
jgi:hypothetical protein